MKYGEFMAAIKKNGMKQIFLLAGEEHYYIDKAEKRLLKALFPNESDMEDGLQKFNDPLAIGEMMNLLETVPFFSEKNVIVIRSASIFKDKKENDKAKEKEMERFIELLSDLPPTNYVIFELAEKPDKRKKIFKTVEKYGMVLEAEVVNPWTINDWLREKLMEIDRRFDAEAMEYFLGAVSMMRPVPLEFLDKELDKLTLFTDKKIIGRHDLELLLSALPEVSGFAMLEAINSHDVKKAIILLERQMSAGTFLPVIVSLIAKQVKQLMLAKALMKRGIRGKQLAIPLGGGKPINPFIAEKIGRSAATFDEKRLLEIYLKLADADYYFKTGKAGKEFIEYLVIELCRK